MAIRTLRGLCSDIIDSLKSYDLDSTLSFRYVKNILIDKASLFLKQDSKLREFTTLSNLWKPLDCFELEPATISECLSCGSKKLVRSMTKLPDVYQTSFGYAIKVFNLDYSKEYFPVTPQAYRDIAARKYKGSSGYYWITDGYLYVPDSSLEAINILGFFKEDAIISEGKIIECAKPLDSSFPFPDYIVTISKQETVKEILGTHKAIRGDETQNLSNAK